MEKKERLVFQGNEFYEIDIECEKKKNEQLENQKNIQNRNGKRTKNIRKK